MKRIFTLSAILSLSILFYSCGDDTPDNLPDRLTASAEKSVEIFGPAGGTTSIPITFTLNDFAGIQEFKNYVKSGRINTTTSFIEVTGVSEGFELVNVKLSMTRGANKVYSFTGILQNEKFQDTDQVNFSQNIIDELVTSKSGSADIELEYKANTAITTPVVVKLHLNSTFSFK